MKHILISITLTLCGLLASSSCLSVPTLSADVLQQITTSDDTSNVLAKPLAASAQKNQPEGAVPESNSADESFELPSLPEPPKPQPVVIPQQKPATKKTTRLQKITAPKATSGQFKTPKKASASSAAPRTADDQQEEKKSVLKKLRRKNREGKEDTFLFNFTEENLVTIINDLASRRNMNFILPQGENAIKSTISLSMEKPVSLDEAWEIVKTALDIAGYTIRVLSNNQYVIDKTANIIAKGADPSQGKNSEPLPIYINVAPEQLPYSDQRIRYLYYMANLKVSDQTDAEFQTVLKNLLPEDAVYKIDTRTNAILVVGKATDIRSVISIMSQLDRAGFKEKMEILKLRHTTADMVAGIFEKEILKGDNQPSWRNVGPKKQSEAAYFAASTKVIPEPRMNAVIILGQAQAVDRVKEFIRDHIDVSLDSGKSVLHTYLLQYLDAVEFKPTLESIVQSKQPGGTDQSEVSAGGQKVAKVERFFDQVIIDVDRTPEEAKDASVPLQTGVTQKTDLTTQAKRFGTNNLIIACNSNDWEYIRKLIEELDQPLPQILIEVLIADLTLDDMRALGANTRNPASIPLPNQMNIQSVQLNDSTIITSPFTPATDDASAKIPADATIGVIAADCVVKNAADLLRIPATGEKLVKNGLQTSAASVAGSAFVSFSDNDGKAWSIMQITKRLSSVKILSHPHIIAVNNKEALIQFGQSRLVNGGVSGTGGGNVTRNKDRLEAMLIVKVRPRISGDGTVNLGITIDINDFESPDTAVNNTIRTRQINTNTTIKEGNVLALGGLTRSAVKQGQKKTPLLGDIPILGYFFKGRTSDDRQTGLTVFLQPKIIWPREHTLAGKYTRDYMQLARDYATESDLFNNLRDPITHWFFKAEDNFEHIIDDFIQKDESSTHMDPPLRDSKGLGTPKNNGPLMAKAPQEQPIAKRPRSHLRA